MNKFLAALAFITVAYLTGCEAKACMPLLPYELKMREAAQQRVFSKQIIVRNPMAQEMIDNMTDYVGLEPITGVERVDVWFDEKDDAIMAYPLQRLTADEDLVSCKVFAMPMKEFVKAIKPKGQEI